jgi:hypothetical protein
MDGVICCALPFSALFYLVVGWAVLRGGCALYNRLVGKGSPECVEEPTFGHAVVVLLAAVPAGALVGFALHGAGGALGEAAGLDPLRLHTALQLQCLPLGLVVLGALLGGTLQTTFSRGLLVAMSCALLVVGVVALVVAIGLGMYALALLAK